MILLISTFDNSHFSIAVGEKKIIKSQIVQKPFLQSELLLEKIDSLIDRKSLTQIIVVSGPGAFSGLRIGIATANALSYALKIPVVGVQLQKPWLNLPLRQLIEKVWTEGFNKLKNKKAGDFVLPAYDKQPNIG